MLSAKKSLDGVNSHAGFSAITLNLLIASGMFRAFWNDKLKVQRNAMGYKLCN